MAGPRLLLADSRIRAAPPVVTPAVRGGAADGVQRSGNTGAPPVRRGATSRGGGGLPGEGVWYDRIGASNFVDLSTKSLGLNVGKSWSGGVLSRLSGVDLPARVTVGGALPGGRFGSSGRAERVSGTLSGQACWLKTLGDVGGGVF